MTHTVSCELPPRPGHAQLALLDGANPHELAAAVELARRQTAHTIESQSLIRVHHVNAVAPNQTQYRAAMLMDAGSRDSSLHEPVRLASVPQQVAFMFPGLGDHYLGMGQGLYRSMPTFRDVMDRGAALLVPELGVDIRDIIYPNQASSDPNTDPPVGRAAGAFDLRAMLGRAERTASVEERRLDETKYAQPALFLVEYALARQWQDWGLAPQAMIGYSLGEYVAACLADVLSFEDSLLLVARRAQLIESLPPGAMLAVLLPEAEVSALLGAHLSLSAVNGPEFCVVSGQPEEVERLEKQLRSRGVSLRRVRSSHAFHSKMMLPLAPAVTRLMEGFKLTPPRIPYISNLSGTTITNAQATDPAYWSAHLCQPVRFAEGLRALLSSILLEVGPGQTLSSLANSSEQGTRTIVASMRHTYDPEPDTQAFLKAMARLWISGAAIDLNHLPQTTLRGAAPVREATEEPCAPPNPAPRWPSTKTEQELAAIWQTLLKCEPPPLDAHFFDAGGNSLVATRLIDRVSKAFRVRLPLRRVYESATLEAMAEVIESLRAGSASPTNTGRASGARAGSASVAPLRRNSDGPSAAPACSSVADRAPNDIVRSSGKPLFRLPNGLVVTHQNEAETRHFYDDIFAHRSYLKHGIRIRDHACVFDVGANIGLFTLFAHTEAKDVRIFSFEPAPPLYDILKRNVERHAVSARLFPHGLSNRECEAPFTFYPRSAGMSSFHPDEAEERHNLKMIVENQRRTGSAAADQMTAYTEELLDVRFAATTLTAKLRRLSDVLRELQLDRIDLMKVDVQKCELEVIEGIDELDWAKFLQIVLEVHDDHGRLALLTSLLERKGFTCVAEQDDLYRGTNIHNIYAIRKGS